MPGFSGGGGGGSDQVQAGSLDAWVPCGPLRCHCPPVPAPIGPRGMLTEQRARGGAWRPGVDFGNPGFQDNGESPSQDWGRVLGARTPRSCGGWE